MIEHHGFKAHPRNAADVFIEVHQKIVKLLRQVSKGNPAFAINYVVINPHAAFSNVMRRERPRLIADQSIVL